MSKKIKIIITIAVILSVAVLTMPLPQKVKKTYTGIEKYSGDAVEISIDATYLRYLVRKDTLKGEMRLKHGDKELVYEKTGLHYSWLWQHEGVDKAFHVIHGTYYDEEMILQTDELGNEVMKPKGFGFNTIFISDDFEKIAVTYIKSEEIPNDTDKIYLGSADGSDMPMLEDYFGNLIKD